MSTASSTAETLLQLIAAHPGTSVGISLPHLQACYDALCNELANTLEKHRSVIIPGFCHFVVQQHVGHSGTWGARVTWVPVFMLLPGFCQSYNMQPSGQTSLNHIGATTPMSINPSALFTACGGAISRHGIQNTIKDLVREIGTFASSGKPMVLDMKFCSIAFVGGKATAVFSPAFVGSLNANNNNRGASSASPRRAPAPPAEQEAARPYRPTPPSTPTAVRPSQPPSRQGAPIPQLADGAALLPAPPPVTARPTLSRTTATPFSEQTRATPMAITVDVASLASPRRQAAEAALRGKLATIEADDNNPSPHHKRTARKLAYRRSRNMAYEESWELSLAAKREAAEREAAADRATARFISEMQVKATEKQRQDAIDRRSELRRIQEVNKELSRLRSASQTIPRVNTPQDIFNSRLHTTVAPHDVATLAKQIEERRLREEQAKKEAERFGEAAWHDYLESKEDERRRKAAAKAEKQAAALDHLRVTQQRKQLLKEEEQREREVEAECHGLAFGSDLSHLKARSVAIQKANYEMVLQRAADRQARLEEDKRARENLIRRLELRDAALREQERRAKTARQMTLRSSWEDQMSEKSSRKQEDKAERDNWRDVNFLRNESSDDEDEAQHKVVKMSPRRVPPPRAM